MSDDNTIDISARGVGEADTTASVNEFWRLALDRIKKLSADARCPLCGSERWSMLERLTPIFIQEYQPSETFSYALGGAHLPSVPVLCNVCGYTMFFNIYGLLGQDVKSFPPYDKTSEAP